VRVSKLIAKVRLSEVNIRSKVIRCVNNEDVYREVNYVEDILYHGSNDKVFDLIGNEEASIDSKVGVDFDG